MGDGRCGEIPSFGSNNVFLSPKKEVYKNIGSRMDVKSYMVPLGDLEMIFFWLGRRISCGIWHRLMEAKS